MHDMGGLTAFLIVLSRYIVFSFSGKFLINSNTKYQYHSNNTTTLDFLGIVTEEEIITGKHNFVGSVCILHWCSMGGGYC
jgi:hypothetical protein